MDHFPYILSAFPETARALSCELVDLLTDFDRTALWKEALALTRQFYGNVEGWKAHLEIQFEATLRKFISTISPNKTMVFCFGLPEYLRQSLIDALIWEVFREHPPCTKLLRCAPGNLILLTSNLDVVNFYHPETTDTHRKQVVQYRQLVLTGRLPGSHGPTSMTNEEFVRRWPTAFEEAKRKRAPARVRHKDIYMGLNLEERTYYNFWGRNRDSLPPL